MAIKKSELYSSLWKSCDELRGGMDASQYKDYVLVLLFVKYVSDRYADQPDALIEVPKDGGFEDMVALKGDKEIGDKINKIIAKLAEANDLKGVIDVADFNDADKLGRGKEMQDRLSNLVAIFENPDLDFRNNRAEGDDILGDAYEYLMRHFATESGKSKGQFYTPAEVSRIMAKVIGISVAKSQEQSIYDPTCGSGSLLLKAADETERGVSVYGQEMDNSTASLAKMNMILHDNDTADIRKDNTLSSPQFKQANGDLKTFDFAVANPPFSSKAWSNGFDPANDEYDRFTYGIPPAKNGDYAFLLHLIKSLKSKGKGAIILPHGVLFRGNVEADIRKEIVSRGLIKAIIGLPQNLFYGTGIPACIIVLDKENAASRKGIFMINAGKGFIKDGNKNRLRAQDIHKIVDTFNKQLEIDKYSRLVPLAEISDPKNDYNLNIPRYIDSTEAEDLQDIDAHLRGGIPNRDIEGLGSYWQVFPSLKDEIFSPADRPGYSNLGVDDGDLKATILNHAEFVAFNGSVRALFERWKTEHVPQLKAITTGDSPKALMTTLSERLLEILKAAQLLDPYDVYQHFMTYWAGTMQDDVYMIVTEDWEGANRIRLITKDNGKNGKEQADLVLGKEKFKMDLIPPSLLVDRYFAEDKEAIEQLEADRDALTRQLEELGEEHGGEDSPLESVVEERKKAKRTDILSAIAEFEELALTECLPDHHKALSKARKEMRSAEERLQACEAAPDSQSVFSRVRGKKGTITKGNVGQRLKALKGSDCEEQEILTDYMTLLEQVTSAKKEEKRIREAAQKKLAEAEQTYTEPQSIQDLAILRKYLGLFDLEKAASDKIKEAQARMDVAVFNRYGELSEDEIRTLVVDDKWLASLAAAVQTELDRVSQTLTGRITQLVERYFEPLPKLATEVESLSARVDEHLKKMGFEWK